MGAYDNPRFFAVDYTAGTRAFQQSFESGIQKGKEYAEYAIANRKAYEEGIYAEGEKLEQTYEKAVENANMTKQEMQNALTDFYDHALKVGDKQKGLRGIFGKREETRIGKKQLRDYTNSFNDAADPIKKLNTMAYDEALIPEEELDLGGEGVEDQLYFRSLQRAGRLKTNMKFQGEDGFSTSFQVLDANGNPTGEEISAAKMSLTFSTDSKAERQRIENDWDKNYKSDGDLVNIIKGNIENDKTLTDFSLGVGDEGKYFQAKGYIKRGVDNTSGLEGYLVKDTNSKEDNDVVLNLKNEDGSFDLNKIPLKTLKDTNDIYNNKVDASSGEKINMFKEMYPNSKLSDEQIERVMDKAMLTGIKGLENDRLLKNGGELQIKDGDLENIYAASLMAKHKLTRNYKIKILESRGILDKFSKPPVEQEETGGLTDKQKYDINKENQYYNVQKSDLNRSINNLTDVIDTGFEVDNMEVNQGAEELKDIFKNKKYEFDGGEKTSITDVNVDYDGNITIYAGDPKSYKVTLKPGDPGYNPDVPIANVKFLADTDAKKATFSAYSPSDYKKVLINFGVETKDPTGYETKANKEIIIRAKELANKGKFKDPKYRQWFNELKRTKSGKKWLQDWAQKNEANATGPLWDEITGNTTPAGGNMLLD